MNILRQTPFPLSVSYDGLTPSTDYALEIYDDHTELELSITLTSDSNGVVSYELPTTFEKYDETYSLYIYSLDVEDQPDETCYG